MTKNWPFAKITDILLKKIEVSDHIPKSLSQQNLRCPSPYDNCLVHWSQGHSRVVTKEDWGINTPGCV